MLALSEHHFIPLLIVSACGGTKWHPPGKGSCGIIAAAENNNRAGENSKKDRSGKAGLLSVFVVAGNLAAAVAISVMTA